MCGIVGMFGSINTKAKEDAMESMLWMDALRGSDSTGLAIINNNTESEIFKAVGTPDLLLGGKRIKAAILRANKRAMIGHNRAATLGKVNARNAHPFEAGNIIGAHNGTLSFAGYSELDDHSDFDVDSEIIFHNINKNGVHNTISKMSGAWSLVWWDEKEETINFLRNSERPMWIGGTQDNSTFLFASEPWMIIGAAMRHNIPIRSIDINQTEENKLYSFNVDNKGIVSEPEVSELKGKTETKIVYGKWNHISGGGGQGGTAGKYTKSEEAEGNAQKKVERTITATVSTGRVGGSKPVVGSRITIEATGSFYWDETRKQTFHTFISEIGTFPCRVYGRILYENKTKGEQYAFVPSGAKCIATVDKEIALKDGTTAMELSGLSALIQPLFVYSGSKNLIRCIHCSSMNTISKTICSGCGKDPTKAIISITTLKDK